MGLVMQDNGKLSNNKNKGEEELLDFDFDKLPEESEEKTASSSDEEILELVDVIEKGKGVENSGSDEIVKLLDDDKDSENMLEVKGSEVSKELELALEDEILQSLESDLDDIKKDFELPRENDSRLDIFNNDKEISDDGIDLEGTVNFKGFEDSDTSSDDAFEDKGFNDSEGEVSAILPNEDLSEIVDTFDSPLEAEKPFVSDGIGNSVGISEERIEAVVSKVVRDVTEKVVTESMERITEKVIKEAIDALKKSLESHNE